MCSTSQQRIAAFGRAIEDLASQARAERTATAAAATDSAEVACTTRVVAGGSGEVAGRLDEAVSGGREAAGSAADEAPRADDVGGARQPGGVRTAAATPSSAGAPSARGSAAAAAPVDVLSRLAELWAELATLDPEVAKRLPTYEL
jgi:hypothetical protein